MRKKSRIKLNKSEEYQVGISVPLIISDGTNEQGKIWLYVNRHVDNKDLLKLLFRIEPQPYATYTQTSGKGKRKGGKEFGYEWVFKKRGTFIKRLKKNNFYV